MTNWNFKTERQMIDSSTAELDTESDALELARMSRDALTEGTSREAEAMDILASIPPVKLGRTVYRVVSGGSYGFDLAGPRGGSSCLVRNLKDPTLWAHNTSSGYTIKTVWYKRETDGSYTRI